MSNCTLGMFGLDRIELWDCSVERFQDDFTSAMMVYQNIKMAAMLVFQTSPVGVQLFFCSNKLASLLTT